MHRQYEIDSLTGYRLCSYCRPKRSFMEKIFEIWPSAIGNWRRLHGYPVDVLPLHFPDCQHRMSSTPPRILSPAASKFVLRRGIPQDAQKILLKGEVAQEVQQVYWFVNSTLLWSGGPTERVFLDPKPGSYHIVLMDEEGQSASRDIVVE